MCSSDLWDCPYVWHSHAPHALKFGIPEAVVEAIRLQQSPPFQREDERAIHDYCHELNTKRTVSDATYQRALALFGAAGMVELTGLTGWYAMVVMSLNAHGFPLPAGATEPFPSARA